MRVLTFNAWGVPWRLASRTRRACAEIRALDPDVVCLQEISFAQARHIVRSEMEADYIVLGADDVADFHHYPWTGYIPSVIFLGLAWLWLSDWGGLLMLLLALALLPTTVYGLVAWCMVGPVDCQGLVMLLRRSEFKDRVMSHQRQPFAVQGYACRVWNPVRWWFETTFLHPGFQKVCVDDGLVIVNSHLVVGARADRSRQLAELRRSALMGGKPVIWAGDMNAEYEEVRQGLDNEDIHCYAAPGGTTLGNENIDMVWRGPGGAHPGIARCCIGHADGEISDHQGVMVDFGVSLNLDRLIIAKT
jgi:hypothetical protein